MEKSKNNNAESDVYVRIDSSDALESRKNLLEVSASIIKMQMLNNQIKKEGKAEVKQRNDAKGEIKSMNILLSHLMAELPKVKVQRPVINEIELVQDPMRHYNKTRAEAKLKVVAKTKPKKATLNDELLEIKRKLEGLKQ